MKCSHCKIEGDNLLKYSFDKRYQRQYYLCQECNNEKVKKWGENNKLRRLEISLKTVEKHKHKQEARLQVRYAIQRKEFIRPLVCENCSEIRKLSAHHTDYSKPLEVKWLCVKCHAKEDRITRSGIINIV